MMKRRNTRRALGIVLVVVGAVMMWAAANPVWGGLVFLAAIVIEAVGIHLEHRQRVSANERADSSGG